MTRRLEPSRHPHSHTISKENRRAGHCANEMARGLINHSYVLKPYMTEFKGFQMVNSWRCWEGGVPREALEALSALFLRPCPGHLFIRWFTSTLYNKLANIKKFWMLTAILEHHQTWGRGHGNPQFIAKLIGSTRGLGLGIWLEVSSEDNLVGLSHVHMGPIANSRQCEDWTEL